MPSRSVVSFAGVWRPTEDGGVFAFSPRMRVEPMHPKAMPVLLDEEDEEGWLSCPFDEAVALARPFPSQLMSAEQAPDPKQVIGESEPKAEDDETADEPRLDL